MNLRIFLLILASVGLSVLAQIALKTGMSGRKIQAALIEGASRLDAVWTIASNGYVVLGLGLYGLGAVLWLLVLARLDVSMAYPFVGLGFVLTMMLGYLILGESLSTTRIVGTLLIAAGVVLVARS